MTSTTTSRRPVSEPLLEDLRAAILRGSYAPGDALPSERRLSEDYAVNRHAVREARGRLEQAGLVEVTQGGATRVRDWRVTGGLELLVDLPLDGPGAADGVLLRSVLEMRRSIGTDVVRLAATRVADGHRAALRAALESSPQGSLERVSARYEQLWQTLVEAAGNLAYALAYNSLLAVSRAAREVFETEARDGEAQRRLVEAVLAGHAGRAAREADLLLSRTLGAVPAAGVPR